MSNFEDFFNIYITLVKYPPSTLWSLPPFISKSHPSHSLSPARSWRVMPSTPSTNSSWKTEDHVPTSSPGHRCVVSQAKVRVICLGISQRRLIAGPCVSRSSPCRSHHSHDLPFRGVSSVDHSICRVLVVETKGAQAIYVSLDKAWRLRLCIMGFSYWHLPIDSAGFLPGNFEHASCAVVY